MPGGQDLGKRERRVLESIKGRDREKFSYRPEDYRPESLSTGNFRPDHFRPVALSAGEFAAGKV